MVRIGPSCSLQCPFLLPTLITLSPKLHWPNQLGCQHFRFFYTSRRREFLSWFHLKWRTSRSPTQWWDLVSSSGVAVDLDGGLPKAQRELTAQVVLDFSGSCAPPWLRWKPQPVWPVSAASHSLLFCFHQWGWYIWWCSHVPFSSLFGLVNSRASCVVGMCCGAGLRWLASSLGWADQAWSVFVYLLSTNPKACRGCPGGKKQNSGQFFHGNNEAAIGG